MADARSVDKINIQEANTRKEVRNDESLYKFEHRKVNQVDVIHITLNIRYY